MVDITSLPQETLKMIFERLDPDGQQSHKGDLYHCTQVCQLWYTIAVRVLYQRFRIHIASPPSPTDVVRRYFTAPHISWMTDIHVLVTAGGHLYATQQQCGQIIQYIRNITLAVSSATNLQLAELDLFAFTPGDCIPAFWPSLQPANDLLPLLVRAIVAKRPELHIRLSRPEIMAEAQAETTSRPVFDNIIREANGNVKSISVGCRLGWLLRWIRDNPQLRGLYYARTSSEHHEIEEFWDTVQGLQLQKLMLDGFEFPPIQRIPAPVVELILTHLNDTASATNAILKHLPNLRVLSLRLERRRDGVNSDPPTSVDGHGIVCPGLRKAWWTMSTAPRAVVTTISQTCTMLDSLSPPRNVTDEDLIAISNSATQLTEIWMMDCPDITESGIESLKRLKRLKYIQLQIRFAEFLTEELMMDFLFHCPTLAQLTLVFDGARDEASRRGELLASIDGGDAYLARLSHAMLFQPSNLGDKFILNIKDIRNSVD